MGNDAPLVEIWSALTPEVRDALPMALTGWAAEAAAPRDSDRGLAELATALGKYIGLTGTSMGVDAREEWIAVAIEELREFPSSLVIDAVKAGRRAEPWPNKLVAYVCEAVQARADRLEAEGMRLKQLRDLSRMSEMDVREKMMIQAR